MLNSLTLSLARFPSLFPASFSHTLTFFFLSLNLFLHLSPFFHFPLVYHFYSFFHAILLLQTFFFISLHSLTILSFSSLSFIIFLLSFILFHFFLMTQSSNPFFYHLHTVSLLHIHIYDLLLLSFISFLLITSHISDRPSPCSPYKVSTFISSSFPFLFSPSL